MSEIIFSIVIPTYNRAHLIEKTIHSVLQQTYKNFEVIIVDDGSSDNTSEVVNAINDPRLYYYKKNNEERAAARNFGSKKAKGSYITFLDSDDLLNNNHFATALETISRYNHPDVFHLGYDIRYPDGTLIKKYDRLPMLANEVLISGNDLSCMGVFLKKEVCLANLFNEDRILSTLEDWELWLRIASKYKIYTSNTITSTLINHEERSVAQVDKEMLIRRFDVFIQYVSTNQEIMNYYKGKIHLFLSSCYTYISLHLVVSGKYKKEGFEFLLKGIIQNPLFIFSRRFLAIIKYSFFKF